MRKFIFLFLGIILFGCNNPKPKNISVKSINTKTSVITITTLGKDTIPLITIPPGTIQVSANEKTDTADNIYIILAGTAHKDDVTPKIKELFWKGLFVAKDKAYIKDARLKIISVHDVLDNDSLENSWEVKSYTKDYGYFISGANLSDGPVKSVKINKPQIYPGEKEEFLFNGVAYTLYATGFKKDKVITNYKLFLMATVKGHSFNQFITSVFYLGDGDGMGMKEQVEIQFIGDIDGDKIPDIIIDTNGDFSGYTDLYLSKPAKSKAILKHVASFGGNE